MKDLNTSKLLWFLAGLAVLLLIATYKNKVCQNDANGDLIAMQWWRACPVGYSEIQSASTE
jgi:hypothetical protein